MNSPPSSTPSQPSEKRLRIGAVSYLNSKPLIEDLAALAPQADLVLDYPSRLADELMMGGLDVALVPSVVVLLASGFEIVGDACVATHGPVLSVKMYSRVPASQIRTLALDAGSRTSATLVRILLAERFNVFPEVVPLPLEQGYRDCNTDALLLIGDRAIHEPEESFECTWDLGEEWIAETGLPFVFALWAARSSVDLAGVHSSLNLSRDRGVDRLDQIASREAPLLGLTTQTTVDYLRNNLYYKLGPKERAGLNRFQQLAVKYQLAPKGIELVFRHLGDS